MGYFQRIFLKQAFTDDELAKGTVRMREGMACRFLLFTDRGFTSVTRAFLFTP